MDSAFQKTHFSSQYKNSSVKTLLSRSLCKFVWHFSTVTTYKIEVVQDVTDGALGMVDFRVRVWLHCSRLMLIFQTGVNIIDRLSQRLAVILLSNK